MGVKKYKVKVYIDGYVTMCEFAGGEWKDCVFDTREEAQKALDDYKEVWGKNGYVYEIEE